MEFRKVAGAMAKVYDVDGLEMATIHRDTMGDAVVYPTEDCNKVDLQRIRRKLG